MKDRVDKSMGIVTLMVETLTKIKPIRVLKIDHVCISHKTKLLRFLISHKTKLFRFLTKLHRFLGNSPVKNICCLL
jgi:hypothetical protein